MRDIFSMQKEELKFLSLNNLREIPLDSSLGIREQMKLVAEIAKARNQDTVSFMYKGSALGNAESSLQDIYNEYLDELENKPDMQIGSRLLEVLKFMVNTNVLKSEDEKFLYQKIVACVKKYQMMLYAGNQIIMKVNEHEGGENMEMPALFGEDEICILYHIEAMILFGRSTLDIIAPLFSKILLKKRIDSFNDLLSALIDCEDSMLKSLKEDLEIELNDDNSVFRMLCGIAKGRALRDIIVHQTTAKIIYDTDMTSKRYRERLHIVIDKEEYTIDFFVIFLSVGVKALISQLEKAVFDNVMK